MIDYFKRLLKRVIPTALWRRLSPYYHGTLSWLWAARFGFPSYKIVTVGITGTKGKTTTAHLLSHILNFAGQKTGLLSTVGVDSGQGQQINPYKMTTLPGKIMQSKLAQMLSYGCKVAVVEASSEGLAQNRHWGMDFDLAIFTNLTPEHIESHGGFENYRAAKGRLFTHLSRQITKSKLKIFPELHKTAVVNLDSPEANFFLSFSAEKKLTYSTAKKADFGSNNVQITPEGSSFLINGVAFHTPLKGNFDIANALGAVAAASVLGIELQVSAQALSTMPTIAGRLEVLQTTPFWVVVDYAHEPASLTQMLQTLRAWPKNKLIHVFGATGGVRDKAKRATMGEISGRLADVTILTNEDTYGDEISGILQPLADGAKLAGKVLDQNLFLVPDRRQAVAKALGLAGAKDLVVVSGKGAEQLMVFGSGKSIPWDDRLVVKEELEKVQNEK